MIGWIIYNSGGYWSDAAENDGASGWITDGSHIETTGKPNPKGFPFIKGCVAVSGEAELGFFGALRTACAIVMDHSILGRIGLGCSIKYNGSRELIIPQDGLSMRFYHVPLRIWLEIDRDMIESIEIVDKDITIHFRNYMNEKHNIILSVYSIPQEGELSKQIYHKEIEMGFDVVSHNFSVYS